MEFAADQPVSQIGITLKADGVAEMNEVILIALTNVTESGSEYSDLGAVIGTSNNVLSLGSSQALYFDLHNFRTTL